MSKLLPIYLKHLLIFSPFSLFYGRSVQMHIAGHDRYEEYERKGKFDFYSFACHSTFVPEDVEKMSINSNHECAKNSKKCKF